MTMIANARMYSVTPDVGALWRQLLELVVRRSGAAVQIVDHRPPAPISELWRRPDKAAVFMCGLPYSLAALRPMLVAAPVPSPPGYDRRPCYWTDLVVRRDSSFQNLEQTFGHRLALTTGESQSGFAAPLHALMAFGGAKPLFKELIEPCFTPFGALTAVIESRAELAPLDSFALALLGKHAPDLVAQVRVIASTEPTAIPPIVASSDAAQQMADAFLAASEDPAAQPLMDRLLLQHFVRPEEAAYDLLRERFEATRAFWRRRRIAEIIHPAFAASFGDDWRSTARGSC